MILIVSLLDAIWMFCGHSLGIIFKLLCAKLFFFRTLHFLEKSVERDEVLHELSLYIGTYVKQTISFGYFRSVYVLLFSPGPSCL